MLLIYLSCAWLAGILLGTYFSLSPWLILTGMAPLPLLFAYRRYRKLIILSSLLLILLFAAATYAFNDIHRLTGDDLRFYRNQDTVTIRGMVSRPPEVSDRSTQIHLVATGIKQDNNWRTVKGKLLLILPRYPAYEYGEVLLVNGELETPPQLGDFDYQSYLSGKGIYTIMHYPGVEVHENGKGSPVLAWLYSARKEMAQTFARVIPEPEASLAQGITLGIRENIPATVKNDFAVSGIAHLLAISGLHLGIIAGMAMSFGVWLFGRRHYHYFWLALGIIWFYALLSGMYPPIIRAAIMVTVFLSADALGRQCSATTALLLAAAIMVGISPYILADVSFQLSFLAMAGLVLIFPVFQSLLKRPVSAVIGDKPALLSAANFVADSFSLTLAAIIAVWPIVAINFGYVSLVGSLATLLSLPALPVIITAGMLTGFIGFIALPVAQVFGWLCWLFLLYLTGLAHNFAAFSFASIGVNQVNPTAIIIYYAALIMFIWFSHRSNLLTQLPETFSLLKAKLSKTGNFVNHLRLRFVVPMLLVMATLVSIAAATMPDDRLHVSFFDVGEGDAILIQHGSQQILIDGGPSPQAINLAMGKAMPFWDRTIELMVISHLHEDHLAGLASVLQRYQVKQILYPTLTYNSPLATEWQRLISSEGIKYVSAQAGQQIKIGGGISLNVINPSPYPFTNTQSDIDNNSIVLQLTGSSVSFLFTADIMQEAELELIRDRAELTSTILKVPHHGAASSSTLEFLAAVNPQIAVISVGADNKFQHPAPIVMERLEQRLDDSNIFRTDRHGTIEFIIDGKRLWVKTRR
ncbi:DNA internalization-related competence protein ComEC/Rec2 [Chloroflexota bacterium]